MSGFCNFCRIWHSGPCCHPGRIYSENYGTSQDKYNSELYNLQQENKLLRQLLDKIISCSYCKEGNIFNCTVHYEKYYDVISNNNLG